MWVKTGPASGEVRKESPNFTLMESTIWKKLLDFPKICESVS